VFGMNFSFSLENLTYGLTSPSEHMAGMPTLKACLYNHLSSYNDTLSYFPNVSFFSLFFVPEPFFQLFKKIALMSLLFGVSCCQIRKKHVLQQHLYCDFNMQSITCLKNKLLPTP